MTATSLEDDEGSEVAPVAHRFRRSLAKLRARTRTGILLEGMSLLTWAFLAYFLLTLGLDKLFRLEQPVRMILLAIWLSWLVTRFWRTCILPLRVDLDDEELSLAVERTRPGLGQELISFIQFHKTLWKGECRGASAELMARSMLALPEILPGIAFSAALKKDRIRKRGAVFGVCLAAVLGCGFGFPDTFGIWAARNLFLSGTVHWPRYASIHVLGSENGKILVPKGDDFTVEAEVSVPEEKYMPDRVQITYWFENRGGATETMVQNTGEKRFSYTFPGLLDEVRFYAHGGDGISETILVELVERPVLEEMKLEASYPEYMGRKPLQVPPEATDLLLPVGASLAVEARSTKPLAWAALSVGDKQVEEASLTEDGFGVTGRIQPRVSGLFWVRLRDREGLDEGEVRRLLVKVVPDKAPRLTLKIKGIGSKVTPQAILPFDLKVRDDFGLEELALYFAVGKSAGVGTGSSLGKEARKVEGRGLENFQAGMERFERRIRFDLLPLLVNEKDLSDLANPVRPGMFLSLRMRAWDNFVQEGRDKGQSALSDSFTFKVVEPTELLADLIRRQSEQRKEFEKVIKAHREDMGDFGTLDSPKVGGERGDRIRRKILSLSRHQRYLSKTVGSIQSRYADIIDEMRNNRLAKPVDLSRLRTRIVDPMEDLRSNWMPELARSIHYYGRSGDAELREQVGKGYDTVFRMMIRILEHMKRLESLTEILSRLKEVIRLEGEAKKRAKIKLEEELRGLLDPDKDKDKKD